MLLPLVEYCFPLSLQLDFFSLLAYLLAASHTPPFTDNSHHFCRTTIRYTFCATSGSFLKYNNTNLSIHQELWARGKEGKRDEIYGCKNSETSSLSILRSYFYLRFCFFIFLERRKMPRNDREVFFIDEIYLVVANKGFEELTVLQLLLKSKPFRSASEVDLKFDLNVSKNQCRKIEEKTFWQR